MLWLSICIPHYNRIHTLRNNLSMIFQATSNEFEVVVVDNCSEIDIRQELQDIRDPRLRIVTRTEPVNAVKNLVNSIVFAKGKYSLLCIDKNYIVGNEIDHFIDFLKKYKDIFGGYCTFHRTEDEAVQCTKRKFKIYRKRALLNFGYRFHHPTGMFFLTKIIKDIYPTLRNREIKNPFACDILATECAAKGAMAIYDFPLWFAYRGLPEENAKSYTYSKINRNVYFLPQQRVKCFFEFCVHSQRLCVPDWVRNLVILRLYRAMLVQVTLGYRDTITNKAVCNHYHTEFRKSVTNHELWQYIKQFNRLFLQSEIVKPKFNRYFLCGIANFMFICSKGKHLL